MDTISRENNSMLPVGGIIVGVIALLLGGFAAIKVSSLTTRVDTNIQPKVDKVDGIEATASSAANNAAALAKELKLVRDTTQVAFNDLMPLIQSIQTSVLRLEEAAKKPVAAAAKGGKAGPVVAGPDEYVIKSGDSFMKIAAAQGFKVNDIVAVNPGVNPSALKPGQKIKLPKK